MNWTVENCGTKSNCKTAASKVVFPESVFRSVSPAELLMVVLWSD